MMNRPEVAGALAEGGRFRVTREMVEVIGPDGAIEGDIGMHDIHAASREGALVTLWGTGGDSVPLECATNDDAARLEQAVQRHIAAARPPAPMPVAAPVYQPQPVPQQFSQPVYQMQQPQPKKSGGLGRVALIGCGGLVALIVVIVVAVSLINKGSSSGGSASKSTTSAATSAAKSPNIAPYQAGSTATSKELSMALTVLTDPYTTGSKYDSPAAGNRFVLYHISATNVDKSEHTVNEFEFKLKTSDNHVYDYSGSHGSTGFKALKLSAGEITEGDIVFEIPSGADVVELKYDNGLGSKDLFWRTS